MSKQSEPLKIGIAGLGTVGSGTVQLLEQHRELIASRAGRPIDVVAVSARDQAKPRPIDPNRYQWFDNPVELAASAMIDAVIELIGGPDGAALQTVETAIASGKAVVTANKAMLAEHGHGLALKAEAQGVPLLYESAIAGGIPIVKSLRESLAPNATRMVYGILNGTCNYVLTTMRDTGRDFADVLQEAQELGYAEADPSVDVDGFDAAHKLTLLAALAFGGRPNLAAVHIEGIRQIAAIDVAFADELGYRIKLLGLARMTEHGLEQRLHPCLVAKSTPIASIEGVLNAVVVDAEPVDNVVHEGRGAGAGPTASAVVADIMDLARGTRLPVFGVPAASLKDHPISPMGAHSGCYYIRMNVIDQPGVMADVAAVLRDHEVSIASLIQRGRNLGQAVPIVLTTHRCTEAALQAAIKEIAALGPVQEMPNIIRIEQFGAE